MKEKAAYLKGLIDGLGIDENTKEGKVIKAMSELLSEMAETVDSIDEDVTHAYDQINDLKNLAVLLKGHAIAKLACRNHRNSSISLMSQMHYAYLYLFYPIPRHLARGFGKKDDENDKKCGIEAL